MAKINTYPKIDIHTHVALPEVLALVKNVKIKGKEPGKVRIVFE